MIIETSKKQFSNESMRLGSKEITFDNKGKFEIDDKEGEEILNKYDFLFKENEIPLVDNKGKVVDPDDKEAIERLKIDIQVYKQDIEEKKKEIIKLKEEVKIWRNKCQEILDGKVTEIKEEVEEDSEISQDLKTSLEKKSFEDLKIIYKETGNSLQGIRSKEQIINKLMELDKDN